MLPESTVLVALMNSPRDFERARDEHWYRIPIRSAPKFFPPEYVAFYFSKAFGPDAYTVRWYAQVRGHELATRQDLIPDEPEHPRAGQRYYRVALGKLVELPHPIPSRRLRRITFILTTGRALTEAWEINDLFVGTREQDMLWRALKEARLAAERNLAIRDASSTRAYHADFAVICHEGTVRVTCGEEGPAEGSPGDAAERTLHFSDEQIEASPEACVKAIEEAAAELGGPADSK